MTSMIAALNQQIVYRILEFVSVFLLFLLIATLLYEMNGKRVNWLRAVPYAIIMTATISVPMLLAIAATRAVIS